MKSITDVASLTEFGRQRLSEHFFMREMLFSEVSNIHGVPNIPDDPDLALEVGRKFCSLVLEPLLSALGHITIRSAFRSARCNGYCHERFKAGDEASWCGPNEYNFAKHIWDHRDEHGRVGAVATVVIPSYIEHFERTHDWKPLGWWIRDNLEYYSEVIFFKNLGAFNIGWYEGAATKAISYLAPPVEELLTKVGMDNFDGDHSEHYRHILKLK